MPSSLFSEVSVITEHVGRYRVAVADLAREQQVRTNEDVVAALFEAERAMRSAERALRRAIKLSD